MAAPASNQFKSDGKLYTLVLSFVGNDATGKPFDPITLDNAQIESFKYENQLNQFYLKSEIICADSLGRIDRLLDKMYVQCQAVFVKLEEKFDGQFTLPKYSDKVLFRHNFIVENISILERKDVVIRYKITLSSINVLKCNVNVSYTNYNLDEKDRTLLNILKSCISQVDLVVDQKSFDAIDTDIKTTFITNGNDTIQTIAKYILNRMFYLSKDNSLKFIRYNETTDTYMMYDIKDKRQALGVTSIMLSLIDNTSREGLTTQIPVNLGTVTRFPQSQTIKSFFKHDFRDYNYNENKFFDRTISSDEFIQYINKAPEVDKTEKKYVWALSESKLDFTVRGTCWNNEFSIYEDMVNNLVRDNALVINCGGDILRRPGDYVSITIDRDLGKLTSEQKAELKDLMTRYMGLEGIWVVYRSTHIVQPANSMYTQNLVLIRNFTLKLEEKLEK